jgi:hypothetical protein
VKIVGRCPVNMLLYPGDSYKSSWVCDCRPLHVYFPKIDSCHKVFSRGPCPERYCVYLPINETVPICVANPCTQSNYVFYKDNCYKLGTIGRPCLQDEQLSINKTTFQLDCQKKHVSRKRNAPSTEKVASINSIINPKCNYGYRVDASNVCKLISNRIN